MPWATEHPSGQVLCTHIFFSFCFQVIVNDIFYIHTPSECFLSTPFSHIPNSKDLFDSMSLCSSCTLPPTLTLVDEKMSREMSSYWVPIVMLLILGVSPRVVFSPGLLLSRTMTGPLLRHRKATLKGRVEVMGKQESKWADELEVCRKRRLSSHD